jgi:tetratricopeptide (TPR) repeat protein
LHVASLKLYEEAGNPLGIAAAHLALGRLANRRGDYAAAQRHLAHTLALAEAAGDLYHTANALNALAYMQLLRGERALAATLYNQALTTARKSTDLHTIAYVLTGYGELARLQDDYRQAEDFYSEAIQLASRLRQKARIVMLQHNLAYVYLYQGAAYRAAALFRSALTSGQELPDKENFGLCLLGLAAVNTVLGKIETAAMLFGAGQAVLANIGAELAPADQREVTHYTNQLLSHLDVSTFTTLATRGRSMTVGELEHLATV